MPLPLSVKQRVRESFDRAAVTYDAAALIQRRAARRLLTLFSTRVGVAPTRILDAGCGTGDGARLLAGHWPRAEILCADFAPAMLRQAQRENESGRGLCFAADIEKLPLANGTADVWWSSFTLQWCDSARVFSEAARTLRQGGSLLLSTLLPETFHEIQAAFSGVDGYRHTLSFDEPDTVRSLLEAAGFREIVLHRERHCAYYPDLRSLLRSIKEIGAQNVGRGARRGMMGRQAWKTLEAAYERYRQAEGLPATYDILFCYAHS